MNTYSAFEAYGALAAECELEAAKYPAQRDIFLNLAAGFREDQLAHVGDHADYAEHLSTASEEQVSIYLGEMYANANVLKQAPNKSARRHCLRWALLFTLLLDALGVLTFLTARLVWRLL